MRCASDMNHWERAEAWPKLHARIVWRRRMAPAEAQGHNQAIMGLPTLETHNETLSRGGAPRVTLAHHEPR